MRLAGQQKGGFYPAPEPAIDLALSKLTVTKGENRIYIVDPCCGKGAALKYLADGIGAIPARVFGSELCPERHAEARELMPNSNIIGPADYLSCAVSHDSWSLAWVNPPFDDELGGGDRVEYGFVRQITPQIIQNGIIVVLCPEKVALGTSGISSWMCNHFSEISIVKFPREHRKFNEVMIFGRKKTESESYSRFNYNLGFTSQMWQADIQYEVPRGRYPHQFRKVELTPSELETFVNSSPLTKQLQSAKRIDLPSPPMSLSSGHIALLLASGHLDGVVCPDNESSHIVRGTATKMTYISNVEDQSDETQNKTVITKSEKIVMTIRAVDKTGTIHTFCDKPESAKEELEEQQEQDNE